MGISIIHIHRLCLKYILIIVSILFLATSTNIVRLLPKHTIKLFDIFFNHIDLVPQHVR